MPEDYCSPVFKLLCKIAQRVRLNDGAPELDT